MISLKKNAANSRCVAPNLTLRAVLDTCVLKLATLPTPVNPAALIVELSLAGLLECWASPAMIEEYTEVLHDHPDFLARVAECLRPCYPLTELAVIRHEPDNRFLECALAVEADFLLTINTARGHFDQPSYECSRVLTPGVFVNLPEVQKLLKQLA